jgi:hypothetical protein
MTSKLRFRLTVDSEVTIFQVNKHLILTQLGLFQENPSLLDAGEYPVKSAVSADVFGQFVKFLESASIKITAINFPSLWSLSEEFDFRDLRAGCVSFVTANHTSMSSGRESRLFQIEERHFVLDRLVIDLKKRIEGFQKENGRLLTMVSKLVGLFESEGRYRRGCEYLYGTNGYDSTSQGFGFSLLKSAADAGHSDAQFECGKCLSEGKGCLRIEWI